MFWGICLSAAEKWDSTFEYGAAQWLPAHGPDRIRDGLFFVYTFIAEHGWQGDALAFRHSASFGVRDSDLIAPLLDEIELDKIHGFAPETKSL